MNLYPLGVYYEPGYRASINAAVPDVEFPEATNYESNKVKSTT